jgi:hypothetical protein
MIPEVVNGMLVDPCGETVDESRESAPYKCF